MDLRVTSLSSLKANFLFQQFWAARGVEIVRSRFVTVSAMAHHSWLWCQ